MKKISQKNQKFYPQRSNAENRMKQKYAIWNYYKKKSNMNEVRTKVEIVASKIKHGD